jgi:hypothetical protein
MHMKFLSEKLKIRNTGYLGLEVNTCIGCFFSYYLTDKCQPNAPLDALPALCCTLPVGEFNLYRTKVTFAVTQVKV